MAASIPAGRALKVFDGIEAIPEGFGPTAVTIGKFDGVHRGHRAVLDRLCALARERGADPVVFTFDRHPLALFDPDAAPEAVVSTAQKVELLAQSPVAATIVARFDREFASTSAEAFVRDVLVGRLATRLVLTGADFRFGARGAGDVELLRRLGAQSGFEVQLVDDVTTESGCISSSFIRELLAAGRVRSATAALGRYHRIRSTVVEGDRIGRELGFPTANLAPGVEGYVPVDGVYAAFAQLGGERYPAAVSIGDNPTFEGVVDRRVEAHLLDARLDLYGATIELDFVEYIRPMAKFPDVDALVDAMRGDAERIRAVLAAE